MWRAENKHVDDIAECVTTQQRGSHADAANTSVATEAGADAGHAEVYCDQKIKQEPADLVLDDEVTQPCQDTNCIVKEEVVEGLYSKCEVKVEVTKELYPYHVIIEEMTIEPEVLRRAVPTVQDTSNNSSGVIPCPRYNQCLSSDASTTLHGCEGRDRKKHVAPPAGGKKKYICDICTKHFITRASAVKHLRIHSGQKPYHCKNCRKQFSRKHHLKNHERTHTGEKPFHCKICKKQFSHKNTLTGHERTHTGEKPFHCKICKKQFCHKNTLTVHERTHTGEKPFQCKTCKKKFSQKFHLIDHERTHTGEKPFHCNICKKQFSRKSILSVHERTHS